jgi:hypothetical protein
LWILNHEEKRIDEKTKDPRYSVKVLWRTIAAVTNWLAQTPETIRLNVGYFGSNTREAAAARVHFAKTNVKLGMHLYLTDESTC